MTATLYLGSHHATARWWALGVPLCVSYRVCRRSSVNAPESRIHGARASGSLRRSRIYAKVPA